MPSRTSQQSASRAYSATVVEGAESEALFEDGCYTTVTHLGDSKIRFHTAYAALPSGRYMHAKEDETTAQLAEKLGLVHAVLVAANAERLGDGIRCAKLRKNTPIRIPEGEWPRRATPHPARSVAPRTWPAEQPDSL